MEKLSTNETGKGSNAPSRAIRFASLILVVVTIAALAGLAYFTERGVVASRDLVIHTYQVRTQLNDLQLQLMRLEKANPARLSAGLRPVQSRPPAEKARQTFSALRKSTADNPLQQMRLDQLAPLMTGLILVSVGKSEIRQQANTTTPTAEEQREDQINQLMASMQDEEEMLLGERLKAWDHLFHRNVVMLGMAFAVVTVMLVYNFWLLIGEVARTKDREEQVRANAQSYRLMSARILELKVGEQSLDAIALQQSLDDERLGLVHRVKHGNQLRR